MEHFPGSGMDIANSRANFGCNNCSIYIANNRFLLVAVKINSMILFAMLISIVAFLLSALINIVVFIYHNYVLLKLISCCSNNIIF